MGAGICGAGGAAAAGCWCDAGLFHLITFSSERPRGLRGSWGLGGRSP